MARTIARVVHDLKPPVSALREIIKVITEISSSLELDDHILGEGLTKSDELTNMVLQYIIELEKEAGRENIQK